MNINYKNTVVKVIPSVYEPAEDSFLLADVALFEIKNSENVLEVGCGSGIISAVIKSNTKAIVTGIDINPHAAACSKSNGVDVIRGDLLNCIKGKFDMIIFNPPYLPSLTSDLDEHHIFHQMGKENTRNWLNIALDGGDNGRSIIERFIDNAGDHLADNGRILMLVSSHTGIKEVKSKMKSMNYTIKEKAVERLMFEQLIVLEGKKSCFS